MKNTFYKHSQKKRLTDEVFRMPGSEYRGAPFWAWNTALDKEVLERQMECFREMGFGGFHMHVRTGLKTPYMGKEFMEAVCRCTEWAKEHDMKAYLYDEDRWPSGTASGEVTKERRFCGRLLRMSPDCLPETPDRRLIAVFDILLDRDGCLEEYRRLSAPDQAKGDCWYAYAEIREGADRFNGQPYVNTLNKEAIQRFLELTHEKYAESCGDDFGSTIPSIFTDEPQFPKKSSFVPQRKNRMWCCPGRMICRIASWRLTDLI